MMQSLETVKAPLMTKDQQRAMMSIIEREGLHRSKWDGVIDKHSLLERLRKIPAFDFKGWRIIHIAEDEVPCRSCRAKRLTRGAHQVVNYTTRESLSEIPVKEDKHLKTLKFLTDVAYARASFEGRLEL